MKKLMKYSLFLLLASTLFIPEMHSVTKVATDASGAAAGDTTFAQNVQATAFYKPTGTMFFGLKNQASADAVGLCERPATDAAPTFTGVAVNAGTAAANSVVRNSNITALDVVGDPTSDTTLRDLGKVKIVFLSNLANSAGLTRAANLGDGVSLLTSTRGVAGFRSLIEGTGTTATCYTMTLVAGNAISGTVKKSYAFSAVKDATGHDANRGNFGAHTRDCIAAVSINNTTLAMTQVTPSTGNTRTCQATGVITTTLGVGFAPLATDTANMAAPALVYSQTLKRLYVGVNYTTSPVANRNTAGWGILIMRVHPESGTAEQLTNQQFPTINQNQVGAIDGGAYILSGSCIVGVGPDAEGTITNAKTGTQGTRASLSYHNLGVMHTSAGPTPGTGYAYLIVNGGNGARAGSTPIAGAQFVGNRVWAVPLVVNPTNSAGVIVANNIGRFASVRSGDFSKVAAAATDLYLTTSKAAEVGDGPLPIPNNVAPTQMWVDGDAVYCSIGITKSNTAGTVATPGIYCSQAIFDSGGKVAQWTSWAKVAPNEIGTDVDNGRVDRFAVDAKTSRMWAVDGAKTSLRMSSWENSSFDNAAAAPAADTLGLLTNLNTSTNLSDGCTAVCDLNSSSTAWGATTPQRISLFGGLNGKVCFAMTGSAVGTTQNRPHSSGQLVATNTRNHHQFASSAAELDYSSSTTLLKTTISGGKTVTCLAYSGWDSCTAAAQTNGYFFAGTEEDGGLYVWAAPTLGAGFNTRNQIKGFDAIPFCDTGNSPTGAAAAAYRTWQKLDRIEGVPVKIEARGGAVYILTRVGGASPQDRIYSLRRQNTGKLLNTDFVVTASTGVSALASVTRIVDFVITTSGGVANTFNANPTNVFAGEQLSMLTNDGIYTTSSIQGTNGISSPANAQLNAGWVQVSSPATDGTAQYFFKQPAYTTNPQTFWFSPFEANNDESDVYNKTSFAQAGRISRTQSSVARFGLNPAFFNAFDDTSTSDADFIENDITTNFYSDGSRRLFQKLAASTYTLASRPYEVAARWWDMSSNNTDLGSAFKDVKYVYWISLLGDSGKLCAGTNKGVVGLV
jgi:hypothetical protein